MRHYWNLGTTIFLTKSLILNSHKVTKFWSVIYLQITVYKYLTKNKWLGFLLLDKYIYIYIYIYIHIFIYLHIYIVLFYIIYNIFIYNMLLYSVMLYILYVLRYYYICYIKCILPILYYIIYYITYMLYMSTSLHGGWIGRSGVFFLWQLGAKNVFWPWLSPLQRSDGLTMAFFGKSAYLYSCIYFN